MENQINTEQYGERLLDAIDDYYGHFDHLENPIPQVTMVSTVAQKNGLASPYSIDLRFYTDEPNFSFDTVRYPRCWGLEIENGVNLGAFVRGSIGSYVKGDTLTAIGDLNKVYAYLQESISNTDDIFLQTDYQRALGRIDMERAVAARVAAGLPNADKKQCLNISAKHFEASFKTALKLKDLSLLLELERHNVNFYLEKDQVAFAITSAIRAFAFAENLMPQRGDVDWFAKGLTKALTFEKNQGNELPLLTFFIKNKFFRKGVVLGAKKKYLG